MQLKSIAKLVTICLLTAACAGVALSQEKKKSTHDLTEQRMSELERKAHRIPSGPNFYIAPIDGTRDFSVLLTDAGNRSLPVPLTGHQVDVLEALLLAAKEFAQTDEAVGGGTAITTRLMDKDEPSVIVDVSKLGNRSVVYLTLTGLHGKMTMNAGEIIRGSKKEPDAFFLRVLAQVQEAKSNARPPQ